MNDGFEPPEDRGGWKLDRGVGAAGTDGAIVSTGVWLAVTDSATPPGTTA